MGDVYAEVREKRKKRQTYFLVFSIAISAYLVLLGASWLVFRSPFFRWQQFEIIGNERVPTDDVMSLLRARALEGSWRPLQALLGLRSMLIWPDELSDGDLAFVPALKRVTLEKNYGLRTIVARVEERKPYGIWCLYPRTRTDYTQTITDGVEINGGSVRTGTKENSPLWSVSGLSLSVECRWFDKDGVVFERAVEAQGGIIMTVRDHSQPFLPMRARVLPEAFIPNLFSIFGVLAASDLDRNEIILDDLALEEIRVTTHNGPTLRFSLRFPATSALAAIKELMSKPVFNTLQYLDFRVENRVYYR